MPNRGTKGSGPRRRLPRIIACMDEATDPRDSSQWRLAVWGLRVIGPGLAVVVAGIVALPWSTGTGQAILAVAIGIYLVGLALAFVEVRRAYGEVQLPRPDYA